MGHDWISIYQFVIEHQKDILREATRYRLAAQLRRARAEKARQPPRAEGCLDCDSPAASPLAS